MSIKIVTNWDSLPPTVYVDGEPHSTRLLYKQYHDQRDEINRLQAELKDALSANELQSISFSDLLKSHKSLVAELDKVRSALLKIGNIAGYYPVDEEILEIIKEVSHEN